MDDSTLSYLKIILRQEYL